MPDAQFQTLVKIFERAFAALDVSVPEPRILALAEAIRAAMTAHTRFYHTLDHIFILIDPDDPFRTLAALYHDVVYYQVDQKFTEEIESLVKPYIHFQPDESVCIAEYIPPQDRMIEMALKMFDLRLGQRLPAAAALNEFLSAVVMLKQLEEFLAAKPLVLITMMIEATIPFRPLDDRGRTHFEVLAERLRRISREYCQDSLSQSEIESGIKDAVLFSNKDIQSFAEPDAARFLDNTWKLLPESNPFHLVRILYTIRSYRQALQQMHGFLCRLEADNIFSQYHGTPPEAEFNRIVNNAHINLRLGCEYLKIRIVAISLLEALAEVSGGDASMKLFLAELPAKNGRKLRFDYFLPRIEPPSWVDTSSTIYRLLTGSRGGDWGYDPVTSPLSLYVYMSLPPEDLSACFELAGRMFDEKVTADEFLRRADQGVVSTVAQASAEIVFIRRDQLLRYAMTSGSA
jgi:hypothetical protein